MTKTKRNYIENKTVKAGLEWMSFQYPHAYQHIIKIDNEGTTNRAEAVRCGLHVGASDLFLPWPTLVYYGAFCEVKPDGWKLTKSKQAHFDSQKAFILKMRQKGYAADMCVGVDAMILFFDTYLKGQTFTEYFIQL